MKSIRALRLGFLFAGWMVGGSGAARLRFKLVAQNKLGDEALASPAICGNRVYLRSAKKGGNRQEYLWCVGQ
jgi:hypothetical protein